MQRGRYERTPAMNARMSDACRRRDRATFDEWCARQQSRVQLTVRRAGKRFADRVGRLPQPDGAIAVDARGTTHGGGPSNYGFLAGDGSS